MASVGPLEAPGRSKEASTSAARFFEAPPERDDLAQCSGDAVADRLDQPLHQFPASGPVGLAVGGDHLLVDAPGRLDFDVVALSVVLAITLDREDVPVGILEPGDSAAASAG
jgi:hypothetical protein